MGGKHSTHENDLSKDASTDGLDAGVKVIRVKSAGNKTKNGSKMSKDTENPVMQSVGLHGERRTMKQVGDVEETDLRIDPGLSVRSRTTVSSSSSGRPESTRDKTGYLHADARKSQNSLIKKKRDRSLQRKKRTKNMSDDMHPVVFHGNCLEFESDDSDDRDDAEKVGADADEKKLNDLFRTVYSGRTSPVTSSDSETEESDDSIDKMFGDALFGEPGSNRKMVLSPTSEAKTKLVQTQNGAFTPVLEVTDDTVFPSLSDYLILTEYSFMEDVEKVEKMPVAKDVDLTVVGKVMNIYETEIPSSEKPKQNDILQELREAHLISTIQGNMSRENTLVDVPVPQKVQPKQPLRLAKLNYKKEKRKLIKNERKRLTSENKTESDSEEIWQEDHPIKKIVINHRNGVPPSVTYTSSSDGRSDVPQCTPVSSWDEDVQVNHTLEYHYGIHQEHKESRTGHGTSWKYDEGNYEEGALRWTDRSNASTPDYPKTKNHPYSRHAVEEEGRFLKQTPHPQARDYSPSYRNIDQKKVLHMSRHGSKECLLDSVMGVEDAGIKRYGSQGSVVDLGEGRMKGYDMLETIQRSGRHSSLRSVGHSDTRIKGYGSYNSLNDVIGNSLRSKGHGSLNNLLVSPEEPQKYTHASTASTRIMKTRHSCVRRSVTSLDGELDDVIPDDRSQDLATSEEDMVNSRSEKKSEKISSRKEPVSLIKRARSQVVLSSPSSEPERGIAEQTKASSWPLLTKSGEHQPDMEESTMSCGQSFVNLFKRLLPRSRKVVPENGDNETTDCESGKPETARKFKRNKRNKIK